MLGQLYYDLWEQRATADHAPRIQEINVCVTPHITSPMRKIASETVKHPSLHDLPLAEPLAYPDKRLLIDILIGLDHYLHYDIIVSDRLTTLIVQFPNNNLHG